MPSSARSPRSSAFRRRVLPALLVLAVLGAVTAPAGASTHQADAGGDAMPLREAGAIAAPPPAAVSAAAASTVYTFGQQPLDDVRYWATQKATCGLSPQQLAAMMLAPTYPETGASGSSAPSPMTLSRYDTQSSLWSFGTRTTAYPRAFWQPGVGAWQFDSAGGWNLTTAQAMNTDSAARQAATTMATRWCYSAGTDAARRATVWSPWVGCGSGVCESIYATIYDPVALNVAVDPGVTRGGGSVGHTCRMAFGDVACTFVDPAQAQGARGWTVAAFGPSPVTAPFYSFVVGTTEYRVWLAADSGYATSVTATKPVTGDARSSLTWTAGSTLCDLDRGVGSCGPQLYLRNSTTTGVANTSYTFIAPSDGTLLMCDWNGDGRDTPGVVRDGFWYLTNSTAGGPATGVVAFGDPGDTPVCGDWNGDGADSPGVVRNGVWYLTNTTGSSSADVRFAYGDPTDRPVVGDWNGDGRDTPGVVRNGVWYLANSVKGTADLAFGFGNVTDLPVVGDWNGDGVDTPGVFRNGAWYLTNTPGRPVADVSFLYGNPDDRPLTGRWVATTGATVAIAR